MAGAALAGGLGLLNTIGLTGGFIGPYAMGLAESVTDNAKSGLWLSMILVLIGAFLGRFLDFAHGRKDFEHSPDDFAEPLVSGDK
jgi:MFS-type transporter involved in bile tolerance (Atg22 family)